MNRPVARPRPRPLVLAGALVAVLAAVLGGLSLPAAAATPCSTPWGSLPVSSSGSGPATDFLTGVRAGQQACYDRLVIDLGGDARGFGGYDVRYAPVSTEGQGLPVLLRGAADLRIIVRAPSYDQGWHPTFHPSDPREVVGVQGFRTFRQVAFAGSFEGQTTLGLGVRARLPFRVVVLPGSPGDPDGARLVVDVAHHW